MNTGSIARSSTFLLAAIAAIAATGCGTSDITAPRASAVAASSKGAVVNTAPTFDRRGGEHRRIEAHLTGYSYPIKPPVGCPTGWRQTGLDFTGTAEQMGAVTWTAVHCNVGHLAGTPVAPDTSVIQAVGGGTMTGSPGDDANGDQITFTYFISSSDIVAVGPPQLLHFVLDITFTGGTGRYHGTSGTGSADCTRTSPGVNIPVSPHPQPYANNFACTLTGTVRHQHGEHADDDHGGSARDDD